MGKNSKIQIIIFLFLFISYSGTAQKLFGGEIYTTYQGNNKYLVSLILYTSCFDVSPGNATIKAKCLPSGTLISSQTAPMPAGVEVTNVCPGQCTRCSKPTCSMLGIKKYSYSAVLDISSAGSCCEIIFCYEQGTRTSLISTGPGGSEFYIESYLNRCVGGNEDVFPLISPEFLAVKNVNYSHALTCYNNTYVLDSIVYEFTKPMKPGRIDVTYSGQYSYDKPVYFWGFPNKNLSYPRGIQLDSKTGQLTFRPVNAETALLAVKIKQFHNGQLYKTFTREWIVNITTQTANNSPTIQLPANQYICSWSGSNIQLTASDPDGDSVFFMHNYQVVSINQTNPDKPLQIIDLNLLTDINKEVYVPLVVRVKDNKCPVPGSSTNVFFLKAINGVSATPVAADSGCGLFHFFVTNIHGKPTEYIWNGDDEMSRNDSSFYFQYYSPNTQYGFNLEIKNKEGCEFKTSGKIKTGSEVSIPVFAGKDDTLCYEGQPALLTGNPEGGSWQGKGIELIGTQYFMNPSSSQIEKNKWNKAIYILTSSGGCVSTDTIAFYILETPKPTAGTYPDLCPNSPKLTLIGNPKGGSWYGPGVSQNQFDPSVGYGKYNLIYQITTNNICPNSDTASLYVAPMPIVKFDAVPPNGNIPLTVLFKDSSSIDTGRLDSYLWNFGDGQTSTQKGDVSHTYTTDGEYSVILIVTSDKGCSNVKIGTNIVSAWKTDLKEKEIQKISVYPTDNNTFKIESGNYSEDYHLYVYSSDGKLLKSIHSNAIENGIIRLNSSADSLLIFRFVKENGDYFIVKLIF